LSVVNLVVLRKGEKEIEGLTDRVIPRRLGPKRASKIRKLFNLTKEDDVRKYVVRREIPAKKEGKKPKTKAPKIQRLVTPVRLQRKRHREALIKRRMAKSKAEAADYAKLLAKRNKEKRAAIASRKSARASARLSAKLSGKGAAKDTKEPAQKKQKKSDKSDTKDAAKAKATKKPAKDTKKPAVAKSAAKVKAASKPAAKAKAVSKSASKDKAVSKSASKDKAVAKSASKDKAVAKKSRQARCPPKGGRQIEARRQESCSPERVRQSQGKGFQEMKINNHLEKKKK
jgi:hypothetical protein